MERILRLFDFRDGIKEEEEDSTGVWGFRFHKNPVLKPAMNMTHKEQSVEKESTPMPKKKRLLQTIWGSGLRRSSRRISGSPLTRAMAMALPSMHAFKPSQRYCTHLEGGATRVEFRNGDDGASGGESS